MLQHGGSADEPARERATTKGLLINKRIAILVFLRFGRGPRRGKPLVSYQTVVQLIAGTSTRTGLKVKCGIDPNLYPAGIKVSDAEMAAINIEPHEFHGEWNYSISPRPQRGKK